MEWYWIIAILLGMVLLLMAIGMPIALGFFVANIIGVYLFMNGEVGIVQMVTNSSVAVTHYALMPVPLFLIMGSLFFRTGLADRVFGALDIAFGRLPGRLSYLTVTGGSLFAALSGSSLANTGMMGTLMVPEMMKRGYKTHMALGPILGSGGLAVIIPPSALAVLLGSLAKIDIASLLISGIIPGLIIAAMYFALIYIQVRIDPEAAPQYDVEQLPLKDKIKALSFNVAPMAIVMFFVVGSIIGGYATPTESAAIGCLSVIALALIYRCINLEALRLTMFDTMRVTAMTFFLIIASTTFSQLMAFSGASSGMVEWATGFDLTPVAMLLVMILVLLALGMFMDQLSMLLLTLPIFLPLAMTLNFDLIWFGLIMLLALEVGFTTPPFGLLLFVMLGVAPPGTTLPQVAMAALPYIACVLFVIGLLILFPELALYLPRLIG